MEWIIIAVGFLAGLLSGAVGFGGGMVLLPVLTSVYGIEVAVPMATIAQLLSNLSRVGIGFKEIQWRPVLLFLAFAAPLTALGAYGFAVVPKALMTRILAVGLIIFAIMKLAGKMNLPKTRATMLIGGGITGLINGLMGISGPLSSAVFLTLGLSPVAYIASEATVAAFMHLVKIVLFGKFALMDWLIFLNGFFIGIAMMCGNFIAMKTIKHINKMLYQKIVVSVMIVASLWLFFSV